MIRLLWLILLLCSVAHANDAAILAACPPEGDAKQAEARALNPLKRRMTIPTAEDIDPRITLSALLRPSDDTERWDSKKAATIEGYVAGVKVGGIESVNCHTHDPLYRDTHIELTFAPNDHDESHNVIVEVTPQWRKIHGPDWTTSALHKAILGKHVRVTGWLFFDSEHKPNAANTAKGEAHIWRATCWELHPVTRIEEIP